MKKCSGTIRDGVASVSIGVSYLVMRYVVIMNTIILLTLIPDNTNDKSATSGIPFTSVKCRRCRNKDINKNETSGPEN